MHPTANSGLSSARLVFSIGSARRVMPGVRFLLLLQVMRIILATTTLFLLSAGVAAQTDNDACHVYVVDVAKSQGVSK